MAIQDGFASRLAPTFEKRSHVGASLLAKRTVLSTEMRLTAPKRQRLTAPKRQIHRQPPIYRRFPSLGKHPLKQLHLLTAQRLLELRAFRRQLKQTLTLVRL